MASERKEVCQQWMLSHTGVRCVFETAEHHVKGFGFCARHRRQCRVPVGADILSAGLPCHAVSRMRARSGQTVCTGEDREHPEFSLIMDEFPRLIQERQPGHVSGGQQGTEGMAESGKA